MDTRYHKPAEIEDLLSYIADEYPLICQLWQIGTAAGTEAFPLFVLKIADILLAKESELEVQLTGGLQG